MKRTNPDEAPAPHSVEIRARRAARVVGWILHVVVLIAGLTPVGFWVWDRATAGDLTIGKAVVAVALVALGLAAGVWPLVSADDRGAGPSGE